VTLSLAYLNKATAKPPIANGQGQYLLRMHKLYNYVGILAVLLACVFVIVPPLVETMDIAMAIMAIAMLLIFGGLGTLCLIYYRNHYLLFDENIIEVRNPKGQIRTISWHDIERASFNSFTGFLILTDRNGGKLKIHQHLVSLGKFVALLEDKTGWTSKDIKLPVKRID